MRNRRHSSGRSKGYKSYYGRRGRGRKIKKYGVSRGGIRL